MSLLILTRHGQTDWNHAHRLAGTRDISINHTGALQARHLATLLTAIPLDVAHISTLRRTQQTLQEIQDALGLSSLLTRASPQLNERDCGAYTGMSKLVLAKSHPTEATLLESDWSYAPPQGESLAMVHARIMAYMRACILPDLRRQKNVIVVSHYNPIRLLVGHFEGLPYQLRGRIQIGNSELLVYKYSYDAAKRSNAFCRITRTNHSAMTE